MDLPWKSRGRGRRGNTETTLTSCAMLTQITATNPGVRSPAYFGSSDAPVIEPGDTSHLGRVAGLEWQRQLRPDSEII